jgi:heparan-alpha-glucosaminide N-acetyltransferase
MPDPGTVRGRSRGLTESNASDRRLAEFNAVVRSERLLSLDVFRGLVILLLIPDTIGGLSFYSMAERHSDHPVWGLISAMFSHVRWSGMSFWDLIMPAFVFMAGVSMAYSYASRMAHGEAEVWVLAHAAIRAIALLVLDLTLQIPIRSNVDYIWPLAVLMLGLQLPQKLIAANPTWRTIDARFADLCWCVLMLALVLARAVLRFDEIPSFEMYGILSSLGLAYFIVYRLMPFSSRGLVVAALSILFLYWLAFVMYPRPAGWISPALHGITSPEEIYSGFMSHWSKGTHVAAAFDTWFLNLFPRRHPYTPPVHGTHTLRCIPVAATLLFGVLVGRALRSGKPREEIRDRLFLLALVGVTLALLLGQVAEPIVMRVWTSTWTIYSTGLILILFTGVYSLIDVHGRRRCTTVLVVAGSNSLLLYVLAMGYRWPILEAWRRAFGRSVFDGYWQPVAESLALGVSLWILAFVLHRFRVFIRL